MQGKDMKKYVSGREYQFWDLDPEHQSEVSRNMSPSAAQSSVWSYDEEYPIRRVMPVIDEHVLEIYQDRVDGVIEAVGRSGVFRPIIVANNKRRRHDPEWYWIEGVHRTAAAKQMKSKTVPALVRVE